MAARSRTWVCGRSLAGIVDSNPALAWIAVVSVVCCQVEVSVSDRSLVQRSPIECDRGSSTVRRPLPTGGSCPVGGGIKTKRDYFVKRH